MLECLPSSHCSKRCVRATSPSSGTTSDPARCFFELQQSIGATTWDYFSKVLSGRYPGRAHRQLAGSAGIIRQCLRDSDQAEHARLGVRTGAGAGGVFGSLRPPLAPAASTGLRRTIPKRGQVDCVRQLPPSSSIAIASKPTEAPLPCLFYTS